MLDRLLHIIGVDLEAKLAQMKAYANALKETARQEFRAELVHAGIVAGFALAALVALAATCVIVLIGLYVWLEPQLGDIATLAVLGSITGAVAIVMFALALTTRKSPVATQEPATGPEAIVAVPRPAPSPVDLAALVAPPPADASLLDVVAHRVSTRAAGAADEVIDAAEETITRGSRTQLVGTIAATIVVGWAIGRRSGL